MDWHRKDGEKGTGTEEGFVGMKYCPKCRLEYQDRISECPDCQERLVDRLSAENTCEVDECKKGWGKKISKLWGRTASPGEDKVMSGCPSELKSEIMAFAKKLNEREYRKGYEEELKKAIEKGNEEKFKKRFVKEYIAESEKLMAKQAAKKFIAGIGLKVLGALMALALVGLVMTILFNLFAYTFVIIVVVFIILGFVGWAIKALDE